MEIPRIRVVSSNFITLCLAQRYAVAVYRGVRDTVIARTMQKDGVVKYLSNEVRDRDVYNPNYSAVRTRVVLWV